MPLLREQFVRLVDLLLCKPNVSDGGGLVSVWNQLFGTVRPNYLPVFLRDVVLIRQPALGLAPDDEQILSG
jgi:hypothetical protein